MCRDDLHRTVEVEVAKHVCVIAAQGSRSWAHCCIVEDPFRNTKRLGISSASVILGSNCSGLGMSTLVVIGDILTINLGTGLSSIKLRRGQYICLR